MFKKTQTDKSVTIFCMYNIKPVINTVPLLNMCLLLTNDC